MAGTVRWCNPLEVFVRFIFGEFSKRTCSDCGTTDREYRMAEYNSVVGMNLELSFYCETCEAKYER